MYLLTPTADSLKHLIQKQRCSLQRISVKCIYLNYIIVLSFYLSSFNFRHRNHYRMCMENVTDCKLGFSQTEDMKFKCILNISPNHNLSTDFYKFLNSIYRYTTIHDLFGIVFIDSTACNDLDLISIFFLKICQ